MQTFQQRVRHMRSCVTKGCHKVLAKATKVSHKWNPKHTKASLPSSRYAAGDCLLEHAWNARTNNALHLLMVKHLKEHCKLSHLPNQLVSGPAMRLFVERGDLQSTGCTLNPFSKQISSKHVQVVRTYHWGIGLPLLSRGLVQGYNPKVHAHAVRHLHTSAASKKYCSDC